MKNANLKLKKFVGRCLRNDSFCYFALRDPALCEADTLYYF